MVYLAQGGDTNMGLLLPLIALAGTAAGTGLSMAGNAQSARAMNNTANDELIRQQEFSKKGGQIYQQNLNQNVGVGNAQEQMGQGANHASALYQALQNAQTGGNSSGLTALNPQTQAQLQGRTGQSNDASSALQGYNSWQTQQGLGNQLAGTKLGVNTTQSQADAANLPFLLQGAGRAGESLQGLGSLFSTIGMGAGLLKGLNGLGQTANAPRIDPGVSGYQNDFSDLTSNPYGFPRTFSQFRAIH